MVVRRKYRGVVGVYASRRDFRRYVQYCGRFPSERALQLVKSAFEASCKRSSRHFQPLARRGQSCRGLRFGYRRKSQYGKMRCVLSRHRQAESAYIFQRKPIFVQSARRTHPRSQRQYDNFAYALRRDFGKTKQTSEGNRRNMQRTPRHFARRLFLSKSVDAQRRRGSCCGQIHLCRS